MVHTVTALETELKLWQAQDMANNFMPFGTVAKHSPVNRKVHTAILLRR